MAPKWILATVIVAGMSVASVNAHAHSGGNFWHNLFHYFGGSHGGQTGGGGGGNHGGSGHTVPELDGATGPIAFALLGGIVAIGLERRRRKNQKDQEKTG